MGKQLDAKKTGWPSNLLGQFKDFEAFKSWYDQRYKNIKAEEVWTKIGGKLPEKPEKKKDKRTD